MTIKVYAPANGTVSTLESLNDGVFSEKMLGDGFVFNSSDSTFFSPIEKGSLQLITDTGHAFFFKLSDDANLLMHIGLDTVKLNGKPFNIHAKLNEKVSLSTKIVDVDFELIKENKLNPACPITVDSNLFKFNLLVKSKEVKKGELIGEFIEQQNQLVINSDTVKSYFNQKNKYEQIASDINDLVGNLSNYKTVYNCMTRLRFQIKDKNLVKEEELKKMPEVKGVIWNNDEIQIVIGQDVYKVKDAVIADNELKQKNVINPDNREFKLKKGSSASKTFLGAVGQIMVPLIPILIGAGMIMALVSILQQAKVMPYFKFVNPGGLIIDANTKLPVPSPSHMKAQITGQDTWYIFNNPAGQPRPPMGWAILYIISTCALKAISVFACASTAKYLKYHVPYAVAIGVIITAPGYLLDSSDVSFTLFTIPGIPADSKFAKLSNILITGQGTSMLVAVATIFAAKYLDDWIKSWIPATLNLAVRPFAVMIIISMGSLFILTPIWYIISTVIGGLINYTKDWYGLGIAFYAIAWQVCVAFGIHLALGTAVALTEYTTNAMTAIVTGQSSHGFSFFSAGQSVGSWAQLGAVIAIMIATKDRKLRRDAGSTVITGFFGVTEPIIYGITLPRVTPFITATAGAGIGGLFAGYMHCAMRIPSGSGVFDIIGYFAAPTPTLGDNLSSVNNGTFIIIANCISLFSAIGLTLLFYKERKNEASYIQTLTSKMSQYIRLSFNVEKRIVEKEEKLAINEQLRNIKNTLTKEDKKEMKNFEKIIFTHLNLQDRINTINEKEALRKNQLLIKGRKLVEKENYDKAMIVMESHSNNNIQEKIEMIESKLLELNYELTVESVKMFAKSHMPIQALNDLAKATRLNNIDKLVPNFENALNSLLIDYKIKEPVEEFDLDDEINRKKFILRDLKIQEKLKQKEARKNNN